MATLYSIDQRLLNLESYGVDTETGEVAVTEEDFKRMYDEIQMDLKDKLINTSCFIKNLKSDVDAFKKEEENLAKRRKVKENLLKRLQDSMDDVIKHRINDIDNDFKGCNEWKLDDPKAKLSYRRSEKVEIFDESLIPDIYKEYVTETKISKAAIKEAINGGIDVKGAKVVQNLSLQIK